MAGIAGKVLSPSLLNLCRLSRRHISSSSQLLGAWNKDWKPGPPTETAEERATAAEKYGLRTEDYIPYNPDTEPGYGDYPKLAEIHHPTLLDPWERRDYPHLGRDYGQTMHGDLEVYTIGERPVFKDKAITYYSMPVLWAQFLTVFLGLAFLDYLCHAYDIKTHMPVMPKQYPDNLWIHRGLDPDNKPPPPVHYTFEPAE